MSGGGQVGAKASAGGGLLRNAPVRRFTAGGHLRGPGTGTSDSLVALTEGGGLARLSRGEFVVRESSASQPGAREFLEQFNRYSMSAIRPIGSGAQRFAEGGLVGSAPVRSEAPKDGRLVVGLESGLVLRELASPAGQKVLVQIMGRNRRAVRTAIGG